MIDAYMHMAEHIPLDQRWTLRFSEWLLWWRLICLISQADLWIPNSFWCYFLRSKRYRNWEIGSMFVIVTGLQIMNMIECAVYSLVACAKEENALDRTLCFGWLAQFGWRSFADSAWPWGETFHFGPKMEKTKIALTFKNTTDNISIWARLHNNTTEFNNHSSIAEPIMLISIAFCS